MAESPALLNERTVLSAGWGGAMPRPYLEGQVMFSGALDCRAALRSLPLGPRRLTRAWAPTASRLRSVPARGTLGGSWLPALPQHPPFPGTAAAGSPLLGMLSPGALTDPFPRSGRAPSALPGPRVTPAAARKARRGAWR